MKEKLIKVMPTGKVTASSGEEMNFTLDDLNEIAESYDGKKNPAPIVIGHPKTNDPAMGWIEKLKVVGEKLFAVPTKVNSAIKKAVDAGEYLKVSPSIYKRDADSNPAKGKLSLRHLGLLGAKAPAIPNNVVLDPANFSGDEKDCETFDYDFSEKEPKETNKEQKIKNNEKKQKQPKTTENFDMNELKEAKAKIEALEAENTKIKLEQKQAENADFCEQLVKKGNILPKHKDETLKLINAINNNQSEEFSEGENPLELVKGLLGKIQAIDFSEKSGDDEPEQVYDFDAPSGIEVDEEGKKRLAKAQAIAREQKIELKEALALVK